MTNNRLGKLAEALVVAILSTIVIIAAGFGLFFLVARCLVEIFGLGSLDFILKVLAPLLSAGIYCSLVLSVVFIGYCTIYRPWINPDQHPRFTWARLFSCMLVACSVFLQLRDTDPTWAIPGLVIVCGAVLFDVLVYLVSETDTKKSVEVMVDLEGARSEKMNSLQAN